MIYYDESWNLRFWELERKYIGKLIASLKKKKDCDIGGENYNPVNFFRYIYQAVFARKIKRYIDDRKIKDFTVLFVNVIST